MGDGLVRRETWWDVGLLLGYAGLAWAVAHLALS